MSTQIENPLGDGGPSGDSVLASLESAGRDIAARVLPSVVSIGRHGRGSGVVVAPGRVLTNAHNLRDRTTQVTFADGRSVQAAVVGADPHGDLAVLEVDTGSASPVEFATDTTEIGSVVFGAARGLRGGRISLGLVASTDRPFRGPGGRPIPGSVEHTAPLARGSSGGALVDRSGKVVGINTHRVGDGFYLALAADDELRERIASLSAGHSVERLTLGIAIAPAPVARKLRRSVGLPELDGLLVRGVEPGSPAGRAGITTGDLLVRAAGRDLTVADDLFEVLDAHDATTPLELAVVRGAEELTVSVDFTDEAPREEGNA
ncbi:MAG TPA: S1C family serine protease [Microthrixaceae bacterium]|nr:S1C family serine protease [Microthrixaceae bacterium]